MDPTKASPSPGTGGPRRAPVLPPLDPVAEQHLGARSLRRLAVLALGAPLRHKLLATVSFASILVLALVAFKVLPKRYQAEASLLVERSSVLVSLSTPYLNRQGDAPTRAAREMVLRRDNLIALCQQVDCVQRHLASRAPAVRLRDWLLAVLTRHQPGEGEVLEDLVDELESRLWVGVANEGTVTITLQWTDPELAYLVVDTSLRRFLEVRYASEVTVVSETVDILEAHLDRVQKEIAARIPQLRELERRQLGTRVQRRADEERLGSPGDEEQARAEVTLAFRRRAMADLEELRHRRLGELREQLAQQLYLYAPDHPSVVATRRNIESLSDPSLQLESLRAETRDLERDPGRRTGLVAGMPEASAARRAALQDARLRRLEADPKLAYEREQMDILYRQSSSLNARLDAARVELDTARAAFKQRYTILAPPKLPETPLRSSARLVLMGAVLGGLFQAFLTTAAVDLRSGRAQAG